MNVNTSNITCNMGYLDTLSIITVRIHTLYGEVLKYKSMKFSLCLRLKKG